MEQSPSGEANSHSDSENLPAFYETRKFITVFIKPSTCPYPEQVESISQPLTLLP
jgi:hypothetical protein